MKEVICILATIFYINTACAQAGISFDANSPGVGGYGNISFTNPGAIGIKTSADIEDADIGGTPYFGEGWNRAVIILQNNQGIRFKKVRLNLYKSEVHYIDSTGRELIAAAGVVKKVLFFDNKDTLKISSVFQQISGVDGNGNIQFIQILNSGKAELMKLTQIILNDRGYDATIGKNNYNFVSKASYYFLNDNVVTQAKGMDKAAIQAFIDPSPAAKNWLADNKNKLKNESEIIGFLNYHNGLK